MYITLNQKYTIQVNGVSFGYDQGIIHFTATFNNSPFIADLPQIINSVALYNSQDELLQTITLNFALDQYQYDIRSDDETDENYEKLVGYLNLIVVPNVIEDE